jgi:hypothetical protein
LTYRGYFNDVSSLLDQLGQFHAWSGAYITLNEPNPSLLARCRNRFDTPERGASTSDKDILSRHWILIDFDPIRPAEISSDHAEHEIAIQRARTVRTWLKQAFGFETLLCDSGNGAHLLIPVELPVNDGGLTETVLQVLSEQFGDEHVQIDQTTFNPSRITKLYGSLTCKGDHTDDRPHRMSRISQETPVRPPAVPAELLQRLAAMEQAKPSDFLPRSSRNSAGQFDVDAFLSKHQISHEPATNWRDGASLYRVICRKWHRTGLEWLSAKMIRSGYDSES